MYTPSLVFVTLFILLKCIQGNDLDIIDSIEQEQSCLRSGGNCVIATDCPEKVSISGRGLCPKQTNKGIDCCYGISVKETRCQKRGGGCMDININCSTAINMTTDCAGTQHCCILIN